MSSPKGLGTCYKKFGRKKSASSTRCYSRLSSVGRKLSIKCDYPTKVCSRPGVKKVSNACRKLTGVKNKNGRCISDLSKAGTRLFSRGAKRCRYPPSLCYPKQRVSKKK